MRQWKNMQGKAVVVVATGVTYRGTVVEMGESALVLKSPGGFQEIPWERVNRMEEASPAAVGPTRRGSLPEGWAS